jgi:hypothetical protein
MTPRLSSASPPSTKLDITPPRNPKTLSQHTGSAPPRRSVLRSAIPPPKKRPPSALPAGPEPSRTKRASAGVNTHKLRSDRLGALVAKLVSERAAAPSWEAFVNNFRGRSHLSPELEQIDHPASELLREWRDHGVPAQTSSEPLSLETRDLYVERGCHRSANEHGDFLRTEMSEFIDHRFWVVLPYLLVRELPELQFSPAAVKDERDRKPRLLCDHSWCLVNDDTVPHAPPRSHAVRGNAASHAPPDSTCSPTLRSRLPRQA